MRVARLHGLRDVRLHEEDRPQPGPGEALVRASRARGVERPSSFLVDKHYQRKHGRGAYYGQEEK